MSLGINFDEYEVLCYYECLLSVVNFKRTINDGNTDNDVNTCLKVVNVNINCIKHGYLYVISN